MKVWQLFALLALGLAISFFVPDWVTLSYTLGVLVVGFYLADKRERERRQDAEAG